MLLQYESCTQDKQPDSLLDRRSSLLWLSACSWLIEPFQATRMANFAPRWKAATGFLTTMIFLLPGTYALECYTSTSFRQFDSKGRLGFDRATLVHNSTCSSSNDVCINAQLEVSTETDTVLVNHRGCFAKNSREAEGATTLGHRYLPIRSNLSYCHSDFCNIRSADGPQLSTEGPTEASHPKGSIQCYSGQNHNSSEINLAKVTCSNSSDLCYKGRYSIMVAGNINQVFYIRSCQNPSCDVPQHQTFGPIKLNFLGGSCCPGSNCSEKEDAYEIPVDTISGPTGASYGESAGDGTTYFVDSSAGNGSQTHHEYDSYNNDDTGGEEQSDPSLHPRGRGPSAKGSSLEFCPLLLAIGMTVCKLGW